MRIKTIGLVFVLILSLAAATQAQTKEAETAAVRQAAMDYLDAVYDVRPELIERSVHPDLVKLGFYLKDGKYFPTPMNYERLHKLAGSYNKEGRIPKDAVKKVEVLDVADQTASAKVTADWGIDYMHLAKYDGKWKIIQILWQSPPKKMK